MRETLVRMGGVPVYIRTLYLSHACISHIVRHTKVKTTKVEWF
jgi:hypothetical protein